MYIYQEYALETEIPWYLIAAIDQYERNTKIIVLIVQKKVKLFHYVLNLNYGVEY